MSGGVTLYSKKREEDKAYDLVKKTKDYADGNLQVRVVAEQAVADVLSKPVAGKNIAVAIGDAVASGLQAKGITIKADIIDPVVSKSAELYSLSSAIDDYDKKLETIASEVVNLYNKIHKKTLPMAGLDVLLSQKAQIENKLAVFGILKSEFIKLDNGIPDDNFLKDIFPGLSQKIAQSEAKFDNQLGSFAKCVEEKRECTFLPSGGQAQVTGAVSGCATLTSGDLSKITGAGFKVTAKDPCCYYADYPGAKAGDLGFMVVACGLDLPYLAGLNKADFISNTRVNPDDLNEDNLYHYTNSSVFIESVPDWGITSN